MLLLQHCHVCYDSGLQKDEEKVALQKLEELVRRYQLLSRSTFSRILFGVIPANHFAKEEDIV